jgi:hypothetical protein
MVPALRALYYREVRARTGVKQSLLCFSAPHAAHAGTNIDTRRPRCRTGRIHVAIALRILAVGEETLRYHQMQIVLGPGHRDIEEATLLFDLSRGSGPKNRRYAAVDQDVFQYCRRARLQHRYFGVSPLFAFRVRIPEKATTLSGAWRPGDPVDDDQGGARA